MLTNPVNVQSAKQKFLCSVQNNSEISPELKQLFCSVKALTYNEVPDYNLIQKYFVSGLKRLKASNSGKLIFNHSTNSVSSTASTEPHVDADCDLSNGSGGKSRSKIAKIIPKPSNMVADAKDTEKVANLKERFTPAAVDSLNKSIAPCNEMKAVVFNNLDRQVQTSPWLYEKYREERRKRRREAATGK